ncbi:MAG: hypothetical protein A4E66_00708 [Syntrophus sp. PtaB.Bin001]|nr:MAG: hypothetical protein A4E66_00708 [Syntrophus sp. PtaB.Bin001]
MIPAFEEKKESQQTVGHAILFFGHFINKIACFDKATSEKQTEGQDMKKGPTAVFRHLVFNVHGFAQRGLVGFYEDQTLE